MADDNSDKDDDKGCAGSTCSSDRRHTEIGCGGQQDGRVPSPMPSFSHHDNFGNSLTENTNGSNLDLQASSGSRPQLSLAHEEKPTSRTIPTITNSVGDAAVPGAHPAANNNPTATAIRKKGLSSNPDRPPPTELKPPPQDQLDLATSNTAIPRRTGSEIEDTRADQQVHPNSAARSKDDASPNGAVPGALPSTAKPSTKAGLRRPNQGLQTEAAGMEQVYANQNNARVSPTKAGLRKAPPGAVADDQHKHGLERATHATSDPAPLSLLPHTDRAEQPKRDTDSTVLSTPVPNVSPHLRPVMNDEEAQAVQTVHEQECIVHHGHDNERLQRVVTHNAHNGLVQANPVKEEELQQAQNVDLTSQQAEQQIRHKQDVQRIVLYLFFGLVLVMCIILPLLFLVVLPAQQEQQGGQSPTMEPSFAPTQDPIQERLQLLLPDYTRNNIDLDGTVLGDISPQTKAYQWTVQDLTFHDYPDWRIVQRFALVTLYYATGGPKWWQYDNWLEHEVHECAWYTRGTTHFVMENVSFPPCLPSSNSTYWSLLLHSNGLDGFLPDELYLLTSLMYLDLNRNQRLQGSTLSPYIGQLKQLKHLNLALTGLEGSLPSQIGDLTSLTSFMANSNSLVGAIPSEIGAVYNLTSIELGQNSITKKIPSEIGMLTQLGSVALDSNMLTGSIPSEIGLINASIVYLGYNLLSGKLPSQLGQLSMLQSLSVTNNPAISGPLPTQVGMMTSLNFLLASRCSLSGLVPSQIGLLHDLGFLSLFENKISGHLPTEVGKMTSLNTLLFARCLLTGPMPSEIGNIGKQNNSSWFSNYAVDLREDLVESIVAEPLLVLSGNMLTGFLPSELAMLTAFVDMRLQANLLSGPVPSELGNLQQLKELHLWDNKLTGLIPSQLGLLTSLEHFQLYYNELRGTIPTELFDLTSVKHFFLSGNQLRGSIPSLMGFLKDVEWFAVEQNQLTNTLPTEVGLLSNLLSLDVWATAVNGTIPTQLGELPQLQVILFSENDMSGSIPSELGGLSSLQVLSLLKNRLTGTLPDDFGSLADMKRLIIHNNLLTGTLPRNWGEGLGELTALSLRSNKLTGTIPDEWGAGFSNLEVIRLDDNQLTGAIPSSFQSGTLGTMNLTLNSFLGKVPSNLCSLTDLWFDCTGYLCGCTCLCNYSY